MSGNILAGLSDSLSARWFSRAVQLLGIPGVPVALLVFVYQYCGKKISRRTIILLCIVPFLSWLVLADPVHYFLGLLGDDLKPTVPSIRRFYFWWVHIPYSYILLTASLGTVFFEISRTSRQYRGQIIILFVAMCVPFVTDLLGLMGIPGETNLSPLRVRTVL